MSEKRHCDVCDEVITYRGGRVKTSCLDEGMNDDNPDLDLCHVHYNSYKGIVRDWMRFEQGQTVTWPTLRARPMNNKGEK